YLSLCPSRPTRASIFMPRASASACVRPSTLICARVRFSVTVRCGNSSKCWNTMPTRERSLGRLVFGSEIEVPSTTMSPFWNGSSAFTVLISVDLPDPDGPQTTTTSPFLIAVVQSVSTWKVPYHLETSLMSIIAASRACSANDGDLPLQPPDGHREAEADHEIDDRGDEIRLDRSVVVLAGNLEALQQIIGADRVDERVVLEQDDRLCQQHRQHV